MRNGSVQANRLPLMKAAALVLAAVVALTSCGRKQLSPTGTVRLWISREDIELKKTAASISGLTLDMPAPEVPWTKALATPETSPDLIYTEWGRDVIAAGKVKSIMQLTPFKSRIPAFRSLLPGFTGKGSIPEEFLPATVYTWGLFYNEEVLKNAGIEPPENWDDFQTALSKLKSLGVVPIALGASFGWPAVAWFSYLDLRLNGLQAHRKLLAGTRPFTDPSLKRVFDTMENWRSTGFFDSNASTMNWPDAMELVVNGKAAFTLLGAFGVTRVPGEGKVRFIQVPSGTRGVDSGELVVAQGYVVSAKAKNAEAALNLASTYVLQNAKGQTGDLYRLPSVQLSSAEGLRMVKTVEREILSGTKGYVPQIDRLFGTQQAYDVNQVFIKFFKSDSTVKIEEFAETLDRIHPAVSK